VDLRGPTSKGEGGKGKGRKGPKGRGSGGEKVDTAWLDI